MLNLYIKEKFRDVKFLPPRKKKRKKKKRRMTLTERHYILQLITQCKSADALNIRSAVSWFLDYKSPDHIKKLTYILC